MGKFLSSDFQFDGVILNDLYEFINGLFDKMGFDEAGYPKNHDYIIPSTFNACFFW